MLALVTGPDPDAHEELQAFAYAVSHDLAEPARTVASFTALLERRLAGQLDDDTAELLGFVLDASGRLQAMLDGLLRYSRVVHGPYAPQDVVLDDVAAEVVAGLQDRIAETGASVEVGPLPVVRGERVQLATVLRELLDNALRFAGDGPPRVEVSADGRRVEVRDHGPGIPPAQADRAFAMFGRLQAREASAGAGVGLAVARRIVDRHGGTLTVAPAPGGGAVFELALPG